MLRRAARLSVGFVVLLQLFFVTPNFVHTTFAAESAESVCSCHCGTTEGAVGVGNQTALSCKDACEKIGATMLTCATDPSAWPINDMRCFTESQCTDSEEKDGYNGVWDERSNPNCPSGYRYCFGKAGNEEVELGVPIGNLKTAADLETYLTKGFQWLLGVAVTVTIVMIMIGGVQYSLGAATADQKSKGLKRIKSGVMGIVLLFCSVLLLQTVNPQLLKLNVPRLPLVKRVLTAEGMPCEEYLEKKYELTQASGKCGDISDVIKDGSGNAVAEGTQCFWRACSAKLDRCILLAGGAKCLSCENVIEGSRGVGIVPSPSVCGRFEYKTETSNGQPYYRQCGWTKDSDLNAGISPKALRHGSCAYYSIDCNNIDACADYDKQVEAVNRNSRQPFEDVILQNDLTCGLNGCGNFGLQTLCEWNPCSEKNGGKIKTACVYDGRWDCQTAN